MALRSDGVYCTWTFLKVKADPRNSMEKDLKQHTSFGKLLCSLCPKNTFALSCPKSCRWVGPSGGHCPALGAAGLYHPASNHRRCKVKENLTPNVHCMEGSWASLLPHFSHPFFGIFLAVLSAFLLLSALMATSAIVMQQLSIQAQPGVAHSIHLQTLIQVSVGRRPSCPGPLQVHGGKWYGWDDVAWSLPQAARLSCLGVQTRRAPQARLQAALSATPSEGCESAPSAGAASLAGGCKRDPCWRDDRVPESKGSKSREEALTADGFCPLLSASCNRPERLPRAGSAMPTLVLLAVQMLSQPLAAPPSLLLVTGREARGFDQSLRGTQL